MYEKCSNVGLNMAEGKENETIPTTEPNVGDDHSTGMAGVSFQDGERWGEEGAGDQMKHANTWD